ncbi:unnamed protein product [Ranitomeya imitator]|uniref:Uncharacterized protein n=1 Tax=Ranitomeya imitator TaxID=111125 RepID=A0ABN9MCN7_9NEOB|nr:unnamed protein product [Ranitomeya imitator]
MSSQQRCLQPLTSDTPHRGPEVADRRLVPGGRRDQISFEYHQKCMNQRMTTPEDSNPWWKAFSDPCKKLGLKLKPEIFPAATDSRYIRTRCALHSSCTGCEPESRAGDVTALLSGSQPVQEESREAERSAGGQTAHGNQGKHRVTKRGPALSYPMFTLVTGIVGRWRAVCVTALQRPNSDAAAIGSLSGNVPVTDGDEDTSDKQIPYVRGLFIGEKWWFWDRYGIWVGDQHRFS